MAWLARLHLASPARPRSGAPWPLALVPSGSWLFSSSVPDLVSLRLVLYLSAACFRCLALALFGFPRLLLGLGLWPPTAADSVGPWLVVSGPGLAWPLALRSPLGASDGPEHLRLSLATRLLPSSATSDGWLGREPRTCFVFRPLPSWPSRQPASTIFGHPWPCLVARLWPSAASSPVFGPGRSLGMCWAIS